MTTRSIEAERAAARIQGLRAAANPPPAWKNPAVLYRANHMAKPVREGPAPRQHSVQGLGRHQLFRPCRNPRPVRVVPPVDQQRRRPGSAPSPCPGGIGHTTLGKLGEFATQHKASRRAVQPHAHGRHPGSTTACALEFGRYINDLEYRARQTLGAENARAFMADCQEIGYEQHLYDSEDSDRRRRAGATAEAPHWMACAGGQIEDAAGTTTERETKSLLEVAQTIALLSTISEREHDQDRFPPCTRARAWSGRTWCLRA